MRELFLRAAAEIHQGRIVLQDAGKDLEVGNSAGKGIRYGLKDVERDGFLVSFVTLGCVAVAPSFSLHPLMLGRSGGVIDDEVHDAVGADVAEPRAEDHGE